MNKSLSVLLKKYSVEELENALIKIFLENHKIKDVKNNLINARISTIDNNIYKKLNNSFNVNNLDELNKLFEELFDENEKTENGIVFTPTFIADYIVKNTVSEFNDETKIIDPSCGCGIFLISAVDYIHKTYKKDIVEIIEKNVFGIDLKAENIERVKIMLSLYCIINKCDVEEINFNIIERDSLFCDWCEEFGVKSFDYIIGNPPYINTQELSESYISKLKKNYETTKIGQFNIFYAFIEKSSQYLKDSSMLGYIIPNNFLHIKSAVLLRQFIKSNNLLNKIIDFKDNMVFAPILTYNAIIFLSKNNSDFEYTVVKKVDDVTDELEKLIFKKKSNNSLDDNGWYLVDQNVDRNLKQIEKHNLTLDPFIKTGIATLRDKIYVLDGYDSKEKKYYKIIDDKKYYIETKLTVPYIKISRYKDDGAVGRIIFPYYEKNNMNIPYDEETMSNKFPLAYAYFKVVREELESREKGTFHITPWFAYGRTQGLNMFGHKIIFSTFSFKANYMDCPEDNALVSNGYCISGYENIIDTDILLKIINSDVMNYYVDNTSYSISGGFKCYQKKYVKNFSIPELTEEDIKKIRVLDGDELNKFLFELYDLIID